MEKDFLAEEMEAQEHMDVQAPSAEEAAQEAKDDRVWKLDDGTEVSKSEFIRDQFTRLNKSRQQISKEFDINYRTVYGATVNMINEAEPSTRGRSAAATKIAVTADGHVITVIEGVVHVDNVAVSDEDAAVLITEDVDRNTWIKAQVEGGRARGDIAAALGLSYGVVYSLTKEVEGASQRHEIEYKGEIISRSEYIRRRHLEDGVSRSDIAKELGVDYPVVWSALKSLKSEDEKFLDAVERVAKFADKVADGESFAYLIEQLKAVAFKEESAESEAAAGTEVTAG